MRDALNRKLPALAPVNGIHTLFDAIQRPTPNQAWLASIDFEALKAKWAAEDEALTERSKATGGEGA